MGVVHKLKQEVLDFIVDSKRDDPKLSCRQISALVEEKFDVHVSKSSVNNVLKKSNLSSNVGRRSNKSEEDKQFKIPSNKKEQLFGEVQKVKKLLKKKAAKKPTKKESTPSDKKLFTVKPVPKKKKSIPPKNDSKNETPKANKKVSDKVKRQRTAFFSSLSEVYDQCGAIFFKCAEWKLSDKPIVTKLLQSMSEYYPVDSDNVYMSVITGSLLSGEENKLVRSKVIEKISFIDDKNIKGSELSKRFEWIKTMAVSEKSMMNVNNELRQIFTRSGGYVVVMDDGNEFFIDVNFRNIKTDIETKKKTCFLNKAIADLSNCLISNRSMPFFYGFDSKDDDPEQLNLFLKVFLGDGDARIEQINLLDEGGSEMSSFTYIPKMPRRFAFGLWPESVLFKNALEGLKWPSRKEIYLPEIDQVFFYSESKFKAGTDDQFTLRRIVFWNDKSDDPIGIIVAYASDSGEYILKQHVLTWSGRFLNLSHSENEKDGSSRPNDLALIESGNILDVLKGFIKMVKENDYDINTLLTDTYNLKGRIGVTRDGIIALLDTSDEEIVQKMNIINSSNIRDYFGRKIFIFPSERFT